MMISTDENMLDVKSEVKEMAWGHKNDEQENM